MDVETIESLSPLSWSGVLSKTSLKHDNNEHILDSFYIRIPKTIIRSYKTVPQEKFWYS
jgi:hypothetical protein